MRQYWIISWKSLCVYQSPRRGRQISGLLLYYSERNVERLDKARIDYLRRRIKVSDPPHILCLGFGKDLAMSMAKKMSSEPHCREGLISASREKIFRPGATGSESSRFKMAKHEASEQTTETESRDQHHLREYMGFSPRSMNASASFIIKHDEVTPCWRKI
jgi:hypothetical protein